MPSAPPSTLEDILATGKIAPAFAAALDPSLRSSSTYTLEEIKRIAAENLAPLQKQLAGSRPPDITETERSIPLRDDWAARVLVCHRTADQAISTPPRPLILLLHGGGHASGHPEWMIPLARELARAHGAVVVCPSYRLAPEYPFPCSILDAWEALQWCARESRKANSAILPRCADPRAGFIVGGESSGATIAASIAHLARDHNLHPPLTGQLLCAGTFIHPQNVPGGYATRYLSREQNKAAPILDAVLADLSHTAYNPDPESRLWASFDQRDPRDEGTQSVKNGHMDLAPAYFQVCGMDLARDDSLIYERVLREECAVRTRMDLYAGWGHCFWAVMPDADMTRIRMKDTIDGVGWLLGMGRKEEGGRL